MVLEGNKPVAVIGAASNIGIRPYDDGREPRHLDRAPAALRARGLVGRLRATDLGDVTPEPYQDFVRPVERVRNEDALVVYNRALAARVSSAVHNRHFVLLLGGDCSIVLGALLGARHGAPIGLAYIDGHADFATPQESGTGSAASMCLAMAVGRGDSTLSRLSGAGPLVLGTDVVLIGRRDEGEPYGQQALAPAGILDITGRHLLANGCESVAAATLDRLSRSDLGGFWIHVDADVLDASIMPAVDSPEPDGPSLEMLIALVAALARHPRALGIELTIYDPKLDQDGTCAERLVVMLERALAGRTA